MLNGFISKEMFFAETLNLPDYLEVSRWLPVFAVLASAFSVAYSLRLIMQSFLAQATDLPSEPHEPPLWMLVPSGILVLTCLLIGIMPQTIIGRCCLPLRIRFSGQHCRNTVLLYGMVSICRSR